MKKSQYLPCLFIFLACVFIYFANSAYITSNDDVPTGLLAFNWLENHQLNFDIFRDNPTLYGKDTAFSSSAPYYFIESDNGHLSAKYPIGPSIVSFPLYILFFICTKAYDFAVSLFSGVTSDTLNLTSERFLRLYRPNFETIAATLLASLSVVIFYLASKLKFNQQTAIISTFIFAFSTSTWVVCSQGLRQHTVSNLILITAILAFLKANRSTGKTQYILLVLAGFFSGLLHASRPTSLLFFAVLMIYCIAIYRKRALFFLLGTSSILLGIWWNIYYFGFSNFLKGGYAQLTGLSITYSLSYFPESVFGILFSPSRGWLVLTPVLLFAIPGILYVFRHLTGNDEKLLASLSLACLALYVHYWFYKDWPGVLVYGPSRFLIDVLPVLCFLINYYIFDHLKNVGTGKQKLLNTAFSLFLVCVFSSTFVQAIGAFNKSTWATIPIGNYDRLWGIQDSVVPRTLNGLLRDVNPPISDREAYDSGLDGRILEITDETGRLLVDKSKVQAGKTIVLKMNLENIGESDWYGYETGMERHNLTYISVGFESTDNSDGNDSTIKDFSKNQVYASGFEIKPGEQVVAIGDIKMPIRKGRYKMHVRFHSESSDSFPSEEASQVFNIRVLSRKQMRKKYGEPPVGFVS